jgi:hypothetical protein
MVGVLYSGNCQARIQFFHNTTMFPDISNFQFRELLSLEIIMEDLDIQNL